MYKAGHAFWVSLTIFTVLLPLTGAACSGDVEYLEPATDSAFMPGQVWHYHTRPGEEGSLLVVGRIDRVPHFGNVVHIKITGLSLKYPSGVGDTANVLTHLPVQETMLLESVIFLKEDDSIELGGFDGGYNNWLDAYDAGRVVVITTSVAEALSQIEQSLSQ